MTIATWILALSTLALAIEGGTALRSWLAHLRLGRRPQELEEIRQEVALLHHAVWMDVSTAGQGSRTDVDEKVQAMLQLDGWAPNLDLMEQAGYFDLRRIQGD